MTDQPDPHTEDRIRRALGARANETTMSPDALDTINNGRSTSRWARPLIYSGVAAAIVLIAGVALLNRPDDGDVVDSVATTTTESADYPTTPTSSTVPDATPPVTDPDVAPGEANQNGLREPVSSTPAEVVAAGLELWRDDAIDEAEQLATAYATTQLGVNDPTLSETTLALESVSPGEGTQTFGVHRRTESGEIADTFAFKIVTFTDDRGPAVVYVLSDAFRIDTVEDNTAETIRVTGGGTAFEGTALLRVNGDESLLMVGGVKFEEFSAVVPRPAGDGAITIVVEGTTVVDNEIPEIMAFKTVPIATQTTLSVFGVADDDVLNVRSGAGVANDIVTTLAPDASGLLPTGVEEFVGSDRWWEIETDAGPGWVNSQFLVTRRNTALTPGLDVVLRQIVETLPDLDLAVLDAQIEVGGIGVYADAPTPWTSVNRDELDSERNWSPDGIDDRECDCDLTVADFLGFDTAKWDLAEYEVPGPVLDPDRFDVSFQHGLMPEFFDRFTTGSIYIPEPNPNSRISITGVSRSAITGTRPRR